MLVTITLLGPAIRYTNYEREFEVDAATPAEAVRQLASSFPDLSRYLYGEDGGFMSYLRFFVDSEPCSCEAMHEPPTRDKIELCITVPVAGG